MVESTNKCRSIIHGQSVLLYFPPPSLSFNIALRKFIYFFNFVENETRSAP